MRLARPIPDLNEADLARFHRKYIPNPETGCWEWLGAKSFYGYGELHINGQLYKAHRISYVLYKGPIPLELSLDHLCRVRHCVNPEHLEAVTHKENVNRGLAKGPGNPGAAVTRNRTHCRKGHEWTDENTYWKVQDNCLSGFSRRCVTCRKVCWTKNNKKRAAKKRELAYLEAKQKLTAGMVVEKQKRYCEVDGCTNSSVGRICRAHVSRMRRFGDYLSDIPIAKRNRGAVAEIIRLESFVDGLSH